MKWLAARITRHPWIVVLSLIIVTGVLGARLGQLETAFSIRTLWDYPENHYATILKEYKKEFREDEWLAVILESDRIFSPPVLRYIQQLSRALEGKDVFLQVKSLSTVQIPRGKGDDVIVGPLYEQVPTNPDALSQIRTSALESNLLVPRLLSANGRYAVIGAEMKNPASLATIPEMEAAVDAVDKLIKESKVPEGLKIYLGGNPVIDTEINRLIQSEQGMFLPLAVLLIIVVLLLVFRSFHGVLLPVSNIIIAVTWTLGLMAWTGVKLNTLSATLPTILLIYGLLDSIFVVSRYYTLTGQGLARREAAEATVVQLGWPCLVASLTTAIGFGSFATVSMPVIQSFGLFMAFGVMSAYVASMLWLPAILTIVRPPKKAYTDRRFVKSLGKFLDRINALAKRRRWAIAGGALVVLIACSLITYSRSKIDIYYLNELPQDTPAMKANNIMIEHLIGLIRSVVVVEGKQESMLEPSTLVKIDQLGRWVKKASAYRSSLALSDVVRTMNQAFHEGDKKSYTIPKSRPLITQYLSLLDPYTRLDLVTDDYSKTQIRFNFADRGSIAYYKLRDQIEKKAKDLLRGFRLKVTGVSIATYHGLETAVRQMLWSVVSAFLLITLLVGVAYRSVRQIGRAHV